MMTTQTGVQSATYSHFGAEMTNQPPLRATFAIDPSLLKELKR